MCVFIILIECKCSARFHVVHPYSSIDTTTAEKQLGFILSARSDFHMIDIQSIAYHAFASHVLMSFSVDETLLQKSVNLSISFRGPPLSVDMSPLCSKHMYSVLSALAWGSMLPAARSWLCSRAWMGKFTRSAMSLAKSASVIVCTGYLLLLSLPA